MYRNLAEDRRTDTIAMANAVGMGFGGDKAYRAWLADQEEKPPAGQPRQPGSEAALRQQGAIMRMQSLFGRQRGALKGAIKIKRPD